MPLTPLPPMHIPDGFLSTPVSLIAWVVSVPLVGHALRRVGRDLGERQVPVMGVLAAAIFAGQMLNFSVTGGTSGHLLGAALATMLLGPWPAIVVMTSVVSIQALIFQDGGLLALGANLFNMGIVGVCVSHFVFRTVRGLLRARSAGILVGGALAAWMSIVVSSLACALELAASGTSPANLAIPAMAGIHALIGLGEAAITVGAAGFLLAARRDLLDDHSAARHSNTAVWLVGAAATAVLVLFSPMASANPDGLEWVAQQQGFLRMAADPWYKLVPGYALPGIADKGIATILAAALGALLVLGTALCAAYLRRGKRGS